MPRPTISAPAGSPSTQSAYGLPARPGYQGTLSAEPPAGAEITRLALFLATPAARRIAGQTLHVGRGVAVGYG